MSTLSDDYLFVVAIDFGTTYSGYAFSSRNVFQTDPLKMSSNQAWNAGTRRLFSSKTPTCLLLNHREDFVSFGYEAENIYTEKVLDGQQDQCFFFQRFKMQLYRSKPIKADMILEDVTGKPFSAMKVFAESIKALKKHLYDTFEERGFKLKKEEIRWVLTVPAIWRDAEKQFMRKSAVMAGIDDSQLVIALEPEAASIYCQYLPTEKLKGVEKGLVMSKVGTQYMVVDNGGGTVDITVHEKQENESLKEVCRASGGDCGGTSVDMGFYQMFVKLVGAPVMNKIKKEEPSAYIDIFREFETVKRIVDPEKNNKVTFTFPRAILDEMCKKHLGEDFTNIVKQSPYKDQMIVQYDKIRIDQDIIKGIFKVASDKIVKLMKKAMKSKNVDLIVLVGGFSQCKLLQDEIKSKFSKVTVIVPEDAGLAIVKGAVLFGHRPDYIISRVSRYTYGIETFENFKPGIHDETKMKEIEGKRRCKNIFYSFVKRGQEVHIGSAITKEIYTIYTNQSELGFPVYRSSIENPMYTDEKNCSVFGTLVVKIPDPSKEKRTFIVKMIFGNTELVLTAQDTKSNKTYDTTFDLL